MKITQTLHLQEAQLTKEAAFQRELLILRTVVTNNTRRQQTNMGTEEEDSLLVIIRMREAQMIVKNIIIIKTTSIRTLITTRISEEAMSMTKRNIILKIAQLGIIKKYTQRKIRIHLAANNQTLFKANMKTMSKSLMKILGIILRNTIRKNRINIKQGKVRTLLKDHNKQR